MLFLVAMKVAINKFEIEVGDCLYWLLVLSVSTN